MQRIVARDGIVLDSVVDKRLERKRRQPPRVIVSVDLQIEEELVRIADLEKIAVRLDELELLTQLDEHALSVLDGRK